MIAFTVCLSLPGLLLAAGRKPSVCPGPWPSLSSHGCLSLRRVPLRLLMLDPCLQAAAVSGGEREKNRRIVERK